MRHPLLLLLAATAAVRPAALPSEPSKPSDTNATAATRALLARLALLSSAPSLRMVRTCRTLYPSCFFPTRYAIIPPSASSEPLGGAAPARRAEECHAHPSHRETGLLRQENLGLVRARGRRVCSRRPQRPSWTAPAPAQEACGTPCRLIGAKTPAVRYDTPAPANEN